MKELKTNSPLLVLLLLTASCFFFAVPLTIAQEKAAQSSKNSEPTKKRKSVIFRIPKNYFSDKFPNRKSGMLMLNPKRPLGMFLVYPDEGESMQGLMDKVKSLVVSMFFHSSDPKYKVNVTWATSPLTKHKDIENESGTMFLGSDEVQEVQIAMYIRNYEGTEIVYGYFAGRKKGNKSEDKGLFLDNAGSGVEDFDTFWKSIIESN